MIEIVIADDFSGSAEIAGIAARSGKAVQICTEVPAEKPDAEIIVIDTNSRMLSPEDAAQAVGDTCRIVRDWGPAKFFKKVDSVLRGPVAAEINAMLDVLEYDRAILLAANPSRGRTIRNGIYFIDDARLTETLFAHDPLYPTRQDNVQAIISCDERFLTPDAVTPEDVARITDGLGSRDLPAGAADFYTAIAGNERHAAPLAFSLEGEMALWVCGSHAMIGQRLEQFDKLSIPVVAIEDPARDYSSELRERLHGLDRVALTTAVHEVESSAELSALADRLTRAAIEVIETWKPTTLFMEGGATARAVVNARSWTAFEVEAELAPGTVVVRPSNVDHAPRLVVKPGSYEWPAACFELP